MEERLGLGLSGREKGDRGSDCDEEKRSKRGVDSREVNAEKAEKRWQWGASRREVIDAVVVSQFRLRLRARQNFPAASPEELTLTHC